MNFVNFVGPKVLVVKYRRFLPDVSVIPTETSGRQSFQSIARGRITQVYAVNADSNIGFVIDSLNSKLHSE
jgi:hypothetical protein